MATDGRRNNGGARAGAGRPRESWTVHKDTMMYLESLLTQAEAQKAAAQEKAAKTAPGDELTYRAAARDVDYWGGVVTAYQTAIAAIKRGL